MNPPDSGRTVLHVSPHPDDESIGAPCTLVALRDAGWRVINLAVSLGRPEQAERRRAELDAALGVAGLEGRTMPVPARISRGDDLGRAEQAITGWLEETVAETDADLVIGPHPEDGHHGHEVVGRAIRASLRTVSAERLAADRPVPVWWMWSIWRELSEPTLVVGCTDEQLEVAEKMLRAHEGENLRNDYLAMHRPQRRVNAVRGAELVFGFGTEGLPVESAELLTEVAWAGYGWLRGPARIHGDSDESDREWEPFRLTAPEWTPGAKPDGWGAGHHRRPFLGSRAPWSGQPRPVNAWPTGLDLHRPLRSTARRLLGGGPS